jgi:hypothetical protein
MKANLIRNTLALVAITLGPWLPSLSASAAPAAPPPKPVRTVTYTEARVWIPEGGEQVKTTNDVILPGKILVATNGVFKVDQGKDRQLLEGQSIGPDGMLTSLDGSVVPVVDHLALRGGRMQLVRDGVGAPLVGIFPFPNGSHVTPEGVLRGPGAGFRRVLDGQLFKLDGTSLPVTDTVSLRRGRVVLYKDGGSLPLAPGRTMVMADGTRVTGNGLVQRPDGTSVRLKEGQILKLPGVRVVGR